MFLYLRDNLPPDTQSRLADARDAAGRWGLLGSEEIPLDEHVLGRVLAEPVWAKISSPHYHASAMDGFAVRSGETVGAAPATPITLVYGEQTAYVDTGDPLPAWADAVIPIENIELLAGGERPTGEARRPAAIRLR